MRKINIGLIGYGTVGTGTAKNLIENKNLFQHSLQLDLNLKYVCDIDLGRKRVFEVDKNLLVRDSDIVLNDKDVDIVVELIGGCDDAREIILKALDKGKHVVTANKALLATFGKEIFSSAIMNNRLIKFEASVGAGIPVIKALTEGLSANKINKIFGIVNGTTNYILSKMAAEKIAFADALQQTTSEGYAELDPSIDVEGFDSAHKIAILSSLAYGKWVDFNDIYIEGITNILPVDIDTAESLGCCIKLLVFSIRKADKIDIRVHPAIVQKNHPLSNVDGAYNAIYIVGNFVGTTSFYGMGAGMIPAASAVVSDIIDIAKQIDSHSEIRYYRFPDLNQNLKLEPIEETVNKYYIRCCIDSAKDAIETIKKVFDKHKIEISDIVDKKDEKSCRSILIILTKEIREKNLKEAFEENQLRNLVKEKPFLLRFFEPES